MTNKHYMKGYRKERKLVLLGREAGCLAFRSAGSHSPVDVVIIDKKERTIQFVQCKRKDLRETEKNKLIEEQKDLQGEYAVKFLVV